jgi:uncharacterized protein YdeI (YjbR/CyaY-like superfamily)
VTPKFFPRASAFRVWLARNHAAATELLVGFHKKGSGRPSMTWPESVDEALCFGWIDGVRRRVDDDSYSIRFSPRRARSIWSAINIKRAEELDALGRMKPAGLRAFAARQENRSGIYSYEQRPDTLPEPYAGKLRKHRAAWKFFMDQSPSYRRKLGWWVVSAKKEETRLARLAKLIDDAKQGRRI